MIHLIINSVIKNTSFPISHNKYVYLGIGIAKYDLLYKESRKPLIFQGFQPFAEAERSGDRTRSSPGRTRTKNKTQLNAVSYLLLACVRGFEPPTFWSVAKRSIQLS